MSNRRCRYATKRAPPAAALTPPTRRCKAFLCRQHAVVTTGRAAGARGVVTGKHGGVDTVLIPNFPLPAMRQMAIGDRIQVWAYGLGLRLTDYPDVAIWNCSPRLLARWQPVERNGKDPRQGDAPHSRACHGLGPRP